MDQDDMQKTDAQQALPYLQRSLQSEAYQRTIRKVAQDLNRRDRSLSRVVHSPLIETPANWLASTLMRPSGILGGGIMSAAGTLLLLFLARFHGLQYNFSVYFLLFLAGFAGGLLAESLLRFSRK